MSPDLWPTWSVGKRSNGFHNPHNYCYRNSVYVTLMHLPDFLQWLRGHQADSCHRAQTKEFCAACQLRAVAVRYWYNLKEKTTKINDDINSATETSRFPYPALALVDDDGDRDVSSMQDAAEFLRFLIDDMSTDFEKGLLQPPGFDKLFTYRTHEQWDCSGEPRRHIRFKEVSTVPISLITITNQQGTEMIDGSLEQYLVEHFFNLREPRTVEPQTCGTCSTPGVDRDLKQLIFSTPQYLILELSATSWAEGFAQKLQSLVSLPLAIDLSVYTDPRQEVYYKLITTVSHQGATMNSGHYVSVTTAPNGKHYFISDEDVEEADDASWLQAITMGGESVQPYLATYARCSRDEYEGLIILEEVLRVQYAEQAELSEQSGEDAASDVVEIHNDDQASDIFAFDSDEVEPDTMEVDSITPEDPFDFDEEELFGTFN